LTFELFGYPKDKRERLQPLTMRGVSFSADPATLREIAQFLLDSADLLELHGSRFGHEHLQDNWKGWKKGFPDLVVGNPDPKPDDSD
jgi:hypothetical protein